MTTQEFLDLLTTPPYRLRWGVNQNRELSGMLTQPGVVQVYPVHGVYLVQRRLAQATSESDMWTALGLSEAEGAALTAAAKRTAGYDIGLRADLLAAAQVMERP